jgi:hypothetical protein
MFKHLKLLEKIIYLRKRKDSSTNGPEIMKDSSLNLSSYEVKIINIKDIIIKNKENGK